MTGSRPGRPLTLRLVLTVVGVSLLGVLLLAALTLVVVGSDISGLARQRQASLADSLTAVAAASYNTGTPGWSDVDLRPAVALAMAHDVRLSVQDESGQIVTAMPTPIGQDTEAVLTRPVSVNGRQVGTVQVQFGEEGVLVPIDALHHDLTGAVIGAAGIAAVAALLVSLAVAHHITTPAAALIGWSRAVSAGDSRARVGELTHAPKELVELAANLDGMADALAAEERLRKEQAEDMAHELRRPLAVLRATCEALDDGVLPLDRRHVRALLDNVRHLEGIVDDVHTVADPRTSQGPGMQTCDLAAIAQTVATAWEASFLAAGVRFHRLLHSAPVTADPRRIRQAIANLLSNSVKFTPPGGQVDLTLVLVDGTARLTVSDTGPGIPAAQHSRVFLRRWRGENPSNATGQGIGLSVTAELVRAQGGVLEMTSRPSGGTAFTLVMPRADPPN